MNLDFRDSYVQRWEDKLYYLRGHGHKQVGVHCTADVGESFRRKSYSVSVLYYDVSDGQELNDQWRTPAQYKPYNNPH